MSKIVDKFQFSNDDNDYQINAVQLEGKTVSDLLKLVCPVGAIYISTVNTNPSTLFGFGTWSQIKDRFLLAAGSTYSAGSTGGSATHTLTAAQTPRVTGTIVMHGGAYGTSVHSVSGCFSPTITNNKYMPASNLTAGATSVGQFSFSNGGQGQAHNNMPPYLTVYIWKRTA